MRSALLLSLLASLMPATQGHGSARAAYATYTFGMSLSTGMNSELFTLFIVKECEGKIIAHEPITRGQFVLQAQGAAPSNANPSGLNLFQKYDVADCYFPEEPDPRKHAQPPCWIFDDVWKLRFQEYPFRQTEGQRPGLGWSENPTTPSPRQFLLLSDYGIHAMSSLACGEDLFRLLHDMGDPEWVDNYRKGY